MRSISSGGQPWRVERVTEPEMSGGDGVDESAFRRGTAHGERQMHSWKMGVSAAFIMPFRKVSTFSPWMPSRS